MPLGGAALTFAADQKSDESLAPLWKQVEEGDDWWVIADRILYRKPPPGCRSQHDKLLVLPDKYIAQVLGQVHDSVWSAHAGRSCTREGISLLFYFSGLSKRVTSYVQSCDICQLLAKGHTADRLPLQSIPMIGEVFSDLEIDILGPELPISRSKKKYVLVTVCVNSKWKMQFQCSISEHKR